jgi:hypothetical protein
MPERPAPFGRGGDHGFGYPTIAEGMETLKVKFRPFASGVDEVVKACATFSSLGS